ncbi:hypothetical protein PspMM1_04400 [Pseudoalteromonas sp. MM1]|nr:hypothetical protein PspMM1_04400 [Pseudoalteromonas sp. MM1]
MNNFFHYNPVPQPNQGSLNLRIHVINVNDIINPKKQSLRHEVKPKLANSTITTELSKILPVTSIKK